MPALLRLRSVAMQRERCPGCGVELPAVDGPVHWYLESSPSCWAAYGELLAREYGDPAFREVHRLTVDAYAVQHPGRPTPQSIQSVTVHLISLYAVLERGFSNRAALALIRRCASRADFRWLEPPASRGDLTVASVLEARTADAHAQAVRAWARSAWGAWSEHHAQVALWFQQAARAERLSCVTIPNGQAGRRSYVGGDG